MASAVLSWPCPLKPWHNHRLYCKINEYKYADSNKQTSVPLQLFPVAPMCPGERQTRAEDNTFTFKT